MSGRLQGLAMVLADEWIGMEVEVVETPNSSEIGMKGVVMDETMNTLRIKTEKSLKTVAKKGRVFRVWYKGECLRVKGDLIAFRPEERIKKGIMLIKRAK